MPVAIEIRTTATGNVLIIINNDDQARDLAEKLAARFDIAPANITKNIHPKSQELMSYQLECADGQPREFYENKMVDILAELDKQNYTLKVLHGT